MKVPKEFKLFGETIKVVFDNTHCDKDRVYGTADVEQNIIYLQTENHGEKLPQSLIETTFLHELMHFIFDKLQYKDMSIDEKLIVQTSALLHQALTTADYGKSKE